MSGVVSATNAVDANPHALSNRYWNSFIFCVVACVLINIYPYFFGRPSSSSSSSSSSSAYTQSKFTSFQRNYLFVFLLAMFSDWLQGPYVYELYVSYGFSQVEIAELFVCGFGSSMVVGTFVGGLADKVGRKAMCVLYCVFYIIACLTKLVPDYWTLMLGRFLSGVATSLLFSVFESWMVCEHQKQGFDGSLIGDTFAYQTLGNGIVAVLAGLVANSAAESYGFVAPFMVALMPLTVVAIFVSRTWNENYGNQQLNVMSSFQRGFDLIRRDSRIAALGMAQSCFEGAMYTFVFMWTPALKSPEEVQMEQDKGSKVEGGGVELTSDYLGLIFAVFMVSVMIGSSIFKLLSGTKYLFQIPLALHLIAFLAMGMVAFNIDNKDTVYTMFLVFEVTVGLFYPAYGTIKAEKIPEDIRSSVMNIFRIPLNAFVVFLLLKIQSLSSVYVFQICTAAHGISFLCYGYFYLSGGSSVGGLPSSKVEEKEEERMMFIGRTSSEYDMHLRESDSL